MGGGQCRHQTLNYRSNWENRLCKIRAPSSTVVWSEGDGQRLRVACPFRTLDTRLRDYCLEQ